MVEKLEGTGDVYDLSVDGDASGIRTNPWIAHLRALERRKRGELEPRAGALAGGLVAAVGARVLGRFDRLSREDHGAVLEAAIDRLAGTAGHSVPAHPGDRPGAVPAHPGDRPGAVLAHPGDRPGAVLAHPGDRPGAVPDIEARVTHAVLCAAIPLDLRRWVAEIDVPAADVGRELGRACRRAAALTGRERSVFFAVRALDHVAADEEVGKVVLRAAVALQMRWNTAHQNVSRAWRKICGGGELGTWCGSFRAGHRFVCGPPSVELLSAARAYMDACSGRGDACRGRDGAAFDAWVEAHEAHNAWFNEWKKQSGHAARRWRELAASLDGSGRRPGAVHAALVQDCVALGIDRWVVPGKLGQQSWRELLDAAHRPALAERGAWVAFLRDNGFGPEPEALFRELERTAALADVASVELEHAYGRLLVAAEQQSGASLSARDAFRALIDRTDGGCER